MRLPAWVTDPDSLTLTEEPASRPALTCISSSGSAATANTVDKLAEYAYEGIPVYLVVLLDGSFYVKMIQEYRLDWASRTYRPAHTHMDELVLEDPFPATIGFAELDG